MSAPPLYDEVDYILHQQSKIDLKTFLQESRVDRHHNEDKEIRPSVDPPQYQCTVSRSGRLYRKLENTTDESGDLHIPFRRSWTEVHAVVRGTKLEFYGAGHIPSERILTSTIHDQHPVTKRLLQEFASSDARSIHSQRTMTLPKSVHKRSQNDLLFEYSLLGTVVGIACDYTKRENVLRVRAGMDQFLIQCNGSKDAVEWLEVLQKGSNIAAPLDTRVEPTFVSAPRRRRPNVVTRNQAYAVFEAASAEAPLRPRIKTICTMGESGSARSYVRSVAPLNRQLESGMIRASAHIRSARHYTIDATPRTTDIGTGAAGIFSVSNANRNAMSGYAPLHLSRKTNRLSKSYRPEHNRKERYVCAILAADHPRQQVVSLPR